MRTCVQIAIEDAGAFSFAKRKANTGANTAKCMQPAGEHRHVLRGRGFCSSVVLNSVE